MGVATITVTVTVIVTVTATGTEEYERNTKQGGPLKKKTNKDAVLAPNPVLLMLPKNTILHDHPGTNQNCLNQWNLAA